MKISFYLWIWLGALLNIIGFCLQDLFLYCASTIILVCVFATLHNDLQIFREDEERKRGNKK